MFIVVDLDGTLADCRWRLHHVTEKPKNWKAFFEGIPEDAVFERVKDYIIKTRLVPVFCTARPEKYKDASIEWIMDKTGLPVNHIYMRKNNDFRPDTEVKSELIAQMIADGITPIIALDDNEKVCHMYRITWELTTHRCHEGELFYV
jgi:hypothetical protein